MSPNPFRGSISDVLTERTSESENAIPSAGRTVDTVINSWSRLLSLASDSGRDIGTIESILAFIDAHPQLIDLPRVLQGLLHVLEAMEGAPVLSLDGCDPQIWRSECEWVITNRNRPDLLTRLGGQFFLGDERRAKNPVIGQGVQDYAFPYATLWHEPQDSDSAPDYYRLVAQLLVAYQQRSNYLELKGQRYSAYLELRTLCGRRFLSIPSDLQIWSSAAGFLRACRSFEAEESIDLLAADFPPIVRLVRYYGGDEPPTRHGAGGQRRRAPAQVAGLGVQISQGVCEFPLDDPDDPDLLPGYVAYLAPQPPDVDLDEWLPPGELTVPRETCLIDTGDKVRPYVAELLRHQGMLAHIARARQFLPMGYGLLTLPELANLLFGATEEFLGCCEQLRLVPLNEHSLVRLRMEAVLALHLMLWSGRPLEDCKKLRLAEHTARPSTPLELLPAGESGVAEFRFLSPSPDYEADEDLSTDTVRPSQKTVLIPDLVGVSTLVSALRDCFPTPTSAVFTCKIKPLEREVRALLRQLGGEDPRYTIHKLRNFLHRQIVADSHDIVAATMLCGVPCLSANTALYYTQYDVNYLRDLYCRSVGRVLQQIYACAGVEASIPRVPAVSKISVGARNCLRLETVRANLDAMLGVLRKRPRTDLVQLVDWHNCLTLWTVQMFHMGTGCRAIRKPLRLVTEFESRWGHGAISDKGADDEHMSRLVVLSDLLHHQLSAYESHCRVICRQFAAQLPMELPPQGGFFLDFEADGSLVYSEIRPRHIRKAMEKVPGLKSHPVNAYRKFVRTELMERGCPSEAVAAFMGHWLMGEEPQDALSSFAPAAYEDSLRCHLLPLMKEVGWIVRNSHLVTEADV